MYIRPGSRKFVRKMWNFEDSLPAKDITFTYFRIALTTNLLTFLYVIKTKKRNYCAGFSSLACLFSTEKSEENIDVNRDYCDITVIDFAPRGVEWPIESLEINRWVITTIIKFSTPNIAFLVFWWDHSTPVISSYSESAYMKMHCVNFCRAEKSLEYPNVQDFMKFDTTIFSFALIGYEIGYSQLGATCLVGYLPSHIQRALME